MAVRCSVWAKVVRNHRKKLNGATCRFNMIAAAVMIACNHDGKAMPTDHAIPLPYWCSLLNGAYLLLPHGLLLTSVISNMDFLFLSNLRTTEMFLRLKKIRDWI